MSEETKNTAQEEETTDTPVTEETVENEPEVVENGEAETEEIQVEDGDEEASQDDKKDSKSKTSFFGKKKKEKDKFEQQIEELTDRLKRNMAEFDNFRKRTEKEKSSMYIIGAKDIVEKMLPVVDNFERGLAQAPEGDSFADGMKMITLDEYLADAPAGADSIFFAAGDSLDRLANMPLVTTVLAKGYDVLLCDQEDRRAHV